MRWVLVAFLALGACATSPDSPYAPRARYAAPVEDGLTIGHRLMSAGEYELALDEYTRAAGQFGFSTDVNAALGSANLALGRMRQAEPYLRQATQSEDATPEMWNNLGVLLLETKRFAEAAGVFRQGFALSNGENDIIRDNLSLALAKSEQPVYTYPQEEERGQFP